MHQDVDFTIDIAGRYKMNIMAVSITLGSEFLGNTSYDSYDLLNGREFKLSKKFTLEAYSGLGLFVRMSYSYNSINRKTEIVRSSSIDVPLRLKYIYSKRNKFGIGLQIQENINADYSILSAFIILQYKF